VAFFFEHDTGTEALRRPADKLVAVASERSSTCGSTARSWTVWAIPCVPRGLAILHLFSSFFDRGYGPGGMRTHLAVLERRLDFPLDGGGLISAWK
jgi:hypothetical protein